MARATAQAAKSGTRPSQVTDGLPARDCWTGATSRRRVDGRAHPTLPDAVPGIERGGSLPPRPHPLERHRRQWNPLDDPLLDTYSLAYSVASLINQLFGKSREPFWQQAYGSPGRPNRSHVVHK